LEAPGVNDRDVEPDPEPDPELDPEPETGWIHADVGEEFPELRLLSVQVPVTPGPSTDAIRERLRILSNRFHGARAITMRQDPIPSAYRIFYRHIGLDPDATRTPEEEAAVQRLIKGGFRPENLVDDALLLALLETGVPLWALDAERLDGPLGIRVTGAGERLGRAPDAPAMPPGRLVVADAEGPIAVLFGEVAPGHGVTNATRTVALFSIQVAGVPAIHVEEALWTCVGALGAE
jgi:DNA/RNA-binding domain of Phe-tRNA-synthetase-like protein